MPVLYSRSFNQKNAYKEFMLQNCPVETYEADSLQIKILQHHRVLLRLAKYFCSQFELPVYMAEDFAQEALIKALKACENVNAMPNDPEKYRGWAYKIVRNHIIDYCRKRDACAVRQRQELPRTDTNGESFDPIESLPDPTSMEEASQLRILFDRVEQTIPESARTALEILQLNFVEGMTYKEIAPYFDTTAAALRTAVHRQKEVLQRHFAKAMGIKPPLREKIVPILAIA